MNKSVRTVGVVAASWSSGRKRWRKVIPAVLTVVAGDARPASLGSTSSQKADKSWYVAKLNMQQHVC